MAQGFFGGFASGMQSGITLSQAAEERELKKQQAAQAQKVKALTFLKDFRGLLEEAAQIEDSKRRGTALTDLFAGYQQKFGQEVGPETMKWITQNPEQFKQVLDLTAGEGMRLDQIFPLLGDPMLRGTVTLALDKAERGRKGAAALAGGDGSPKGENTQPTVGNSADSQTGGSPLTGPTPALEAQAQALEQQIAGLGQRISVVARAGNTQGVAILEQQRKALQDRLAAIREKPALDAAGEDRKPVPVEELRAAIEANPGIRTQLRPGITRGEFSRLTQPAAPALPSNPQTGGSGGLRSPAEVDAEKQTTERRSRRLDPNEMTAQMRAAGITTQGQLEDAVAAGKVRMPTNVDLAEERAVAAEGARAAFKRLEEITKKGDEARGKRPQLEIIGALYDRVGPTGALVGPLRQSIGNALQLFGVQKDELAGIQTMDAATLRLASAMLKDYSGNDSDRDVLNAIESNPNIRKTKEANRALLAIATSEAERAERKAVDARRWTAQFGAISRKDPETGLAFEEAWDKHNKSLAPIIDEAMRKRMGLNAPRKGR